MNIGTSTDSTILTEEWLINNGFILFDGDEYQKHYCPKEGINEPYRWMLSVSPHDKISLKEASIPLEYVFQLHFIYSKL